MRWLHFHSAALRAVSRYHIMVCCNENSNMNQTITDWTTMWPTTLKEKSHSNPQSASHSNPQTLSVGISGVPAVPEVYLKSCHFEELPFWKGVWRVALLSRCFKSWITPLWRSDLEGYPDVSCSSWSLDSGQNCDVTRCNFEKLFFPKQR